MNRSELLKAAPIVALAACAGGAGSPILTPQSRGIAHPLDLLRNAGISPAHKWKEYDIGTNTLIGPFNGQRAPGSTTRF